LMNKKMIFGEYPNDKEASSQVQTNMDNWDKAN